MFEKGLLYRGVKPVYWSPSSRTALAEAELEYNDEHKSISAYIAFDAVNVPEKLQQFDDLSFLIWTTTPWTIPSNRAICIHNDIEYVVAEHNNKHLVLAKSRIEALEALIGSLNIVMEISGSDIDGCTAKHPMNGRDTPIFHGDHVQLESGSGLVHTGIVYVYTYSSTRSWS